MDPHLKKQLLKSAFITSPIIGLILITPVFIFSGIDLEDYWPLIFLITLFVFASWIINLSLIVKINKPWILKWPRIIVSGSFMLLVGIVAFYLIDPKLPFDIARIKLETLRFVNVMAVNAIIYVLIDLISEKENKDRLDKENSDLKIANLEAKFNLLKDQINPHFLFNSLGTIKSLIKRQPELAQEFIIKLSSFLRASITTNQKTSSLKEEINLCTDYIAMQKIRFGEALQVNVTLPEITDNYFLPHFSILTLLENAIKHNSLTTEDPLLINITFTEETIIVSNTLKEKFVLEDSPKTGLKNLTERYALLTNQKLEITKTTSEFIVSLKLLKQ